MLSECSRPLSSVLCFQSINSSNGHIHCLQWSVSWCLLLGGGHWDREIESLSQHLTVCRRQQNWSWVYLVKSGLWPLSHYTRSSQPSSASAVWLEKQIPGLHPSFLNQRLWGGIQRPEIFQGLHSDLDHSSTKTLHCLCLWSPGLLHVQSKTFLQESSPCPGKSSLIPWPLRVSPFCATRGCSHSFTASWLHGVIAGREAMSTTPCILGPALQICVPHYTEPFWMARVICIFLFLNKHHWYTFWNN